MSFPQRAREAVAVVGGGLGGLAAACTLAARGERVLLFDKNPWLGGKAALLDEGGFRFDMGPTILTLPSVLARVFGEAGIDVRERLELVPLDPQWRSFFEDGSTLDLWADAARMRQALDRFAPERAGLGDQYDRFLRRSKRLRDLSDRYFFWRSVGSMRDLLGDASLLRPSTLGDLLAMSPGRTAGGLIRSFVKDARVAQMLDHFTQYVGSAPDASPAVLCGIADMQTQDGVWYPMGGIRALAEALVVLAHELGVEVHTSSPVDRIEVEGDAVRAVVAAGRRFPVRGAVCNSDVVRAHDELLPDRVAARFRGRRTYEPACSGVVLYLGLRERYDHLLHHNFVFSADPHAEFESIYRRGEPAPDPTCYVCAPAATDPGVAPAGGEALYVLVHTPYLRPGQDWSAMLPAYRRTILDKLARTAGLTDLEERIAVERVLTPQDIHDRYHVLNGAIYGLASHGRFTGAFKPGNLSPDVRGLAFAGGSAHPGPGMPMVLMSGWIAADALTRQLVPAGVAS